MVNKSRAFVLILWALISFFSLVGCNISDNNKKDSLTSGTIAGSGSSGGPPANVTVTAINSQLVAGGTTIITIIITDSQGRRTEATITLTSSNGGTFNGTNPTWSGNTLGGALLMPYTATAVVNSTEITATVNGTNIKGSTVITINSNTTATHTVTPLVVANTGGATNGTITPNTAQTVTNGSSTVFILNPNAGFTPSVSGTCGGVLVGNTYTTNSITSDCTVIASFNP